MVWQKRTFGPGPERLPNTFLNSLAGQVMSNSRVPGMFRPGVIVGCDLDFSSARKVGIGIGAGITAGRSFAFEEPWALEVQGGRDGDPVWIYVNAEGEPAFSLGMPPGWPDHVDQPTVAERSYCVLGWAVYGAEGWLEPRDVRRYVRCVPNDSILVVGDVDAGADFEHLQQALDYMEACDLGRRKVSRQVVVTQVPEVIETQVHVRVPGVSVSARLSGDDLVPGPVLVPLRLNWSFACTDPAAGPLQQAEEGALFNLHGVSDCRLEGLEMLRQQSVVPCAIWNPGDRLEIARCSFVSRPDGQVLQWFIGSPGGKVLRGVRIEDSTVGLLSRGLLWFAGTYHYDGQGLQWLLEEPSSGCLQHGVLRRNTVVVEVDVADWEQVFSSNGLFDKDYVYPVVDCGLSSADGVVNVVAKNRIIGGMVSVRVGRRCRAQDNTIDKAGLYGVWVDTAGIPAPDGETALGEAEVSGNAITLIRSSIGGSPGEPELTLPWWRAGVRLDLSHCRVVDNHIDLYAQDACGVVDGCVQTIAMPTSAPGIFLPFEGEAPSQPGAEVVPPQVLANERAHGGLVLTEIFKGVGFRVTPADYFEPRDALYLRPTRIFTLTADEQAEEPRCIRILVAADAENSGQAGWVEPNTVIDSHTQPGRFTVQVDDRGITGFFRRFRDPPDGGQWVKGNEIVGGPIERIEATQVASWMAGTDAFGPAALFNSGRRLMAGNAHGELVTLDATTGAVIYRFTLSEGNAVVGEPAILSDVQVFACTADGFVHGRAVDGEPHWQAPYSLQGTPLAPPTLGTDVAGNNLLFVASDQGAVHCLNAATGSAVWVRTIGFQPAPPGPAIRTKPCYTENLSQQNIVAVGADDGYLYFLAVDSGGQNFRQAVGTGAPVLSSPVGDGASVFAGSDSGKLFKVDVSEPGGSGAQEFTIGAPVRSSPVLWGAEIYFGADDQRLHIVRQDFVSERTVLASSNVLSRPAVGGEDTLEVVTFGSADGVVYARKVSDLSEVYTHNLGSQANGAFVRGPHGVVTNLNNGRLFSLQDEPIEVELISPPEATFGVLLLSKHNRVAGNKVTSVSCGVHVLDHCKVGDNVIYSAWLGIVASRSCTVHANQVWWYRTFNLPLEVYPRSPFFTQTAQLHGFLATTQNSLSANEIHCLPQVGPVTATLAGGISFRNVPLAMLAAGTTFAPKISGVDDLSVFVLGGGNVARGNQIDLGIDAISFDVSDPAHPPPELYYAGALTQSGLVGPIPLELADQGFNPADFYRSEISGFNVFSSNQIQRCGLGCYLLSTDIVRDCTIRNVGAGVLGKGVRVEGCHLSENLVAVAQLGRMSTSRGSDWCASYVRDSVLMIPADPLVLFTRPQALLGLPAVTIDGDACVLHDCFIANHDGPGVSWKGSQGSCVGCYFFTMKPGQSFDPNTTPEIFNLQRQAAIVFKTDEGSGNPATQGNLVVGAHLANARARVLVEPSSAAHYWDETRGPILNAGDNPCPPEYQAQPPRWTNRICWNTQLPEALVPDADTCYHLTVLDRQPVP